MVSGHSCTSTITVSLTGTILSYYSELNIKIAISEVPAEEYRVQSGFLAQRHDTTFSRAEAWRSREEGETRYPIRCTKF